MGDRDTPEAAMLAEAISLAALAHGGQTDKAGEPYLLHPLRVMLACKTLETRLAAVLHDTVEDTDITLEDIAARFPLAVVAAVDALTCREGETYFEYIGRARENPIAREVKMADLRDNYLNPERQATLRPDLRERYAKAMSLLQFGEPQPIEAHNLREPDAG
jgi:(p)ppGpp synthase/HD superfamily hydrolase